jgi:hypothetical protein
MTMIRASLVVRSEDCTHPTGLINPISRNALASRFSLKIRPQSWVKEAGGAFVGDQRERRLLEFG